MRILTEVILQYEINLLVSYLMKNTSSIHSLKARKISIAFLHKREYNRKILNIILKFENGGMNNE